MADNGNGGTLQERYFEMLLERVIEDRYPSHQLLDRIEAGTLSDEEVERLGRTFMALSERMDELKEVFGLTDEDLNLNLGPLGNLL